MKRGEIRRVTIERLAPDGSGYIGIEGRAVTVKGTLPGDEVDIRLLGIKRKTARGKVLSFIRHGVERVPAKCKHFSYCGGCRWQDVPYDVQCDMKAGLVRGALTDIPGVVYDGEIEVVPSPDTFYYRNKMEFSFDSPPSANGKVFVGLHEAGKFDSVFDVEHCYLQSELSNRVIAAVRDFVRERGLCAHGLKSHVGLLRFLMIRDAKNTDDLMVNVVTSGDQFDEVDDFVEHLRCEAPAVTTIVRSINRGMGNVTYTDERDILIGDGTITERIGDLEFIISPDSFFQTNPHQTKNLYDTIKEFSGLTGSERLLDLYCGTGTIGMYLADGAESVTGIELVDAAVEDARKNAALNNIGNIEFISGQVEKTIDESMNNFDVVICDPPRAGIHPKALDQLLRMRIPRMVYVSCNVKAMPHDLEMLAMAGYGIRDVRVFDMSPHTPHVETVVKLEIV